MGKFLINEENKMPDILFGLLKKNKRFKPFKNKNFEKEFDDFIKNYKKDIPNYYKRIKEFKRKFIIYTDFDDRDMSGFAGIANEYDITFYKGYARDYNYLKKRYITHELTHCIQFLFEPKSPGRPSSKVSTELFDSYIISDSAYYNDRYELETISNDIFKDLMWKFKSTPTQSQAKAFIEDHHDFKFMNKKNKKNTLRKVMIATLYKT